MRRTTTLGALLALVLLLAGCSGAPAEKGEDSAPRGDASVEEPADHGMASGLEGLFDPDESEKDAAKTPIRTRTRTRTKTPIMTRTKTPSSKVPQPTSCAHS